MLECGLYQGGYQVDRENREAFPFKTSQLDVVVISHTHLDHCGLLPKLVKEGYRGPLFIQGDHFQVSAKGFAANPEKEVGAVKELIAGAHLFDKGASYSRVNSKGYVTSVCYSPTIGTYLGLGFLENGRARHGEVITVRDHLRNITEEAEVCDPVFFDPDGGRARG